jgi:hypothetical protein
MRKCSDDENEGFRNIVIHQLSLGLAEVLESVENVSIASHID